MGIFNGSSLITIAEDIRSICGFFDKEELKGQMVYKATRDGFSFNNFISRVLNKPNLLSIIKTEHNKIFGSFVSIPRTQSDKRESD